MKNLGLKIFSLLCGGVLWYLLYTTGRDTREHTLPLSLGSFSCPPGWVVYDISPSEVPVRLSGPKRQLDRLGQLGQLEIRITLSPQDKPDGQPVKLPLERKHLFGLPSGVELAAPIPTIGYVFDRLETRLLPVRPIVEDAHKPSKEWKVLSAVTDPSSVPVSGPARILDQAEKEGQRIPTLQIMPTFSAGLLKPKFDNVRLETKLLGAPVTPQSAVTVFLTLEAPSVTRNVENVPLYRTYPPGLNLGRFKDKIQVYADDKKTSLEKISLRFEGDPEREVILPHSNVPRKFRDLQPTDIYAYVILDPAKLKPGINDVPVQILPADLKPVGDPPRVKVEYKE